MLESIFTNAAADTMTFGTAVLIILSVLALGLVISLVYMITHRKESYTAGFVIALIMLPAIIAMIIYLVGNNVARAFSLAGAFSLIRFRSAPCNSKDIAYVFFTLGVGLACGMGYIAYAVLFAVIMCLVMVILTKLRFGSRNNQSMLLKIVIPEHMDYDGVFDGVLDTFTTTHKLMKVKTKEFGALFELTYQVSMKNAVPSKSFIDQLRCLNGNMNVALMANQQNEEAVF
jgi:hypothetical protein